jgi:hypothetical protein
MADGEAPLSAREISNPRLPPDGWRLMAAAPTRIAFTPSMRAGYSLSAADFPAAGNRAVAEHYGTALKHDTKKAAIRTLVEFRDRQV